LAVLLAICCVGRHQQPRWCTLLCDERLASTFLIWSRIVNLSTAIRNERFSFANLCEVFAKANEEKSGDQLANLAARSERERVAAKFVLADLTLEEIVDNPLIDPEVDEISRLILDSHNRVAFAPFCNLTVGEFREWILDDATTENMLVAVRPGLIPEIAAAVAKLMSNKDLVLAASKVRVVSRCRNTMGQRGVLGIRIQPNHPSDDIGGILLSAADGLFYGCGDAVIGVNPTAESVDSVTAILHALDRLIDELAIPTQACCLAHITTQLACLDRGAPVDLLFQSIAGTQAANASFGINLTLLREGQERTIQHHLGRAIAWVGNQAMYFETGQGSALSAGAHHGIDQLTLEARAYGVARAFDPFLVNSVVGFIGPEYLFDERQIIRAGLEDHFMGKLLGLPMGIDVCYTNHAEADQNSADNLLLLLATAGCNYFMGVPCADDVMLNYQSTSFHDALAVRRLFGLRPAPEFNEWLEAQGLSVGLAELSPDGRARGRILEQLGTVLEKTERIV
jgi:ethanolamine ammonia-lyase large subunit